MNPIVAYIESDNVDKPSTRVGTIVADEKGRMVFRDNESSLTITFIDAHDSGTLADALSKSNIKFTLPDGEKRLF